MPDNSSASTMQSSATSGTVNVTLTAQPVFSTIVAQTSPMHVTLSGTTRQIENAVYAYIQAIRTLGRTQVNTLEIAKGLNLTAAVVEKTLAALEKKGVKVA